MCVVTPLPSIQVWITKPDPSYMCKELPSGLSGHTVCNGVEIKIEAYRIFFFFFFRLQGFEIIYYGHFPIDFVLVLNLPSLLYHS